MTKTIINIPKLGYEIQEYHMNKIMLVMIVIAMTVTFSTFANGDGEESMDAMTTASIVTDADAFAAALGTDGTWIAAALNDITIKGDLIVEGAFMKDDKPYRKLALYTQDDDHKVIDSFTLTADMLVVRSEHTRIQNGTFVGDVMVEAKDFELKNSTVEGNLYFASDELKATFIIDDASSVTGDVGVKM